MPWDIEGLRRRFASKQRSIETDLDGLRKHKIPHNSSYKSAYDRQLGALEVYMILETTEYLRSPDLFLAKLKDMRDDLPSRNSDEYDQNMVVEGWNGELDRLIKEFLGGEHVATK